MWQNQAVKPSPTSPVLFLVGALAWTGFTGGAKDAGDSVYGDDNSDVVKSPIDTGTPPFCTDEDLQIKINGERIETVDDPRVGDVWQVFMFCHNQLMTGANVLQFSPPSIATVEDNETVATFNSAGNASMMMQSGTTQYRTDLTVLPSL